MISHESLTDARFRALFRDDPEFLQYWLATLINARSAIEHLEELGWTEADLTRAKHDLCRAVMSLELQQHHTD